MLSPKSQLLRRNLMVLLVLLLSAFLTGKPVCAADEPFAAAVESARKTRDEKQLTALKGQLEGQVAQNAGDAALFLELAKVHFYLLDVYEMRNDKKAAGANVDKAIEAAQRSIQLDDKSADAHSLLADLYGRKISLGNAMFAGPKFGPKVKEENAKAIALDDKNPRVWASFGRQYLMTPKMFGGDVSKSITSFQKSLAIDASQDETWSGSQRRSRNRATRRKLATPSSMLFSSILRVLS
jgi:cytochrome c-type biogenesis protein CcmH/NrfG